LAFTRQLNDVMTSVAMLHARFVFWFAPALVLLVSGSAGFAGEAIVLGKEKPKNEAVKESKFGKEVSRPWDKMSPETPMGGLMFPMIPQMDSVDPKADRKRKIQDREKKNWMSVQPGELQEEEEAKTLFGVRNYDIEKEEDSDNLMFREVNSERSGSQAQGRSQKSRSSNQKENSNAAQRADAEELERELAARRAARTETSRNESQYGVHTASELNFKGLFGAAPTEARSDASRGMFGGSDPAAARQQALREEFKTFLNGKPNNAGGGLSDSANNWRQPLNPAIGKSPESARNDVFGPSSGFAPRQANALGTPMGFGDRSLAAGGTPAWGLNSPAGTPQPDMRSQPPPPNRGIGMNSLGGHSR
jgi:hypothetical protein